MPACPSCGREGDALWLAFVIAVGLVIGAILGASSSWLWWLR